MRQAWFHSSEGELKSPIGPIYGAHTELGVCLIAIDCKSEEDFARMARKRGIRLIGRSRERLAEFFGELREYFELNRSSFRCRPDLDGLREFSRAVLLEAAKVRAGETVSYGELARRVRRPGAARAVGQVMAHNPVPLLVPCHRVISSDGSLGGFGAGLEIKRWLLAHEGARAWNDAYSGAAPPAQERRAAR